MLTQDDPHNPPAEEVYLQIGGREVRFVYDLTTKEEDEFRRMKEVAIYREDDGTLT